MESRWCITSIFHEHNYITGNVLRLTEPSNIRIASLASSTLPIVTNANPLLLSVTRSYTIYQIQSHKKRYGPALDCTTNTLNSSIKQKNKHKGWKGTTKLAKRRNLNRHHGAGFSKELCQLGISNWIWQVSNIDPPSIVIVQVWNLSLFLLFCFFRGFCYRFVLSGLCYVLTHFEPIEGGGRWGQTMKWEKWKTETLGLEVKIERFLKSGSLKEVGGEWKGRVGEGKVGYSVADRGGKRSCSSHLVCERERLVFQNWVWNWKWSGMSEVTPIVIAAALGFSYWQLLRIRFLCL